MTHEEKLAAYVVAGNPEPYEPKPGERVRILEVYPHGPYPNALPGDVVVATFGTELLLGEEHGRRSGWLSLFFEKKNSVLGCEYVCCRVEPAPELQ